MENKESIVNIVKTGNIEKLGELTNNINNVDLKEDLKSFLNTSTLKSNK